MAGLTELTDAIRRDLETQAKAAGVTALWENTQDKPPARGNFARISIGMTPEDTISRSTTRWDGWGVVQMYGELNRGPTPVETSIEAIRSRVVRRRLLGNLLTYRRIQIFSVGVNAELGRWQKDLRVEFTWMEQA
jgi:hypothetical protein